MPRADPGGALAELVRGVRWVGLAWDQAARPVVSWEQSGFVYVRQWDAQTAQYTTRGPWAGCDPVLMCDAPAHLNTADSDVTLYHLDAARAAVVARTQRDLYGVPRTLGALTPGAVLDQAVCLPYAVQLLGEDVEGALALLSEPYPVAAQDLAVGLLAFRGGEVYRVLFDAPAQDLAAGLLAFVGGELMASLYPVAHTEAVMGAHTFSGGDFAVVLFARTAADSATGGHTFGGGDLSTVLIPYAISHALSGALGFAGGSYA
ncbi:hypothetical protein [Deinococcus xianganensis]|uniref:Uncharacterized protein n=1 Tax=Deinococcus xianganensis TaxID=1507289 RepID=A0A6I4YHY1_9DEIO|nr:hypothetical protein [Deinococcus xianganensis]MXV18597.1 hypothetical protein [Deinococcus xianganensis]